MDAPDTLSANDLPSGVVLVVVGSTLHAEQFDRPLAYRLRERILDRAEAWDRVGEITPVVCSDLWYLNTQAARLSPAIALGEPEANAATASIASRLPAVFVMEGVLRVHLDPEFLDYKAALWGISHDATASAVDLFTERFLDRFLGES